MNTMFNKEAQKELKAQYKVLLADVWGDERMIDYCSKKADVVVKTEQGFLIEVEKENIETSFCFGYRLSHTDTEEYDAANKMAEYARKSESYFIEKNLAGLKNTIKHLSENELYAQDHYISQKNHILKNVITLKSWEEPKEDYIKLSDSDKELIIEAYKVELERFEKRLNTYLKRYGTSKLHTWSYWQDA